MAFGEFFYFSEPQWYICQSRGVKQRCWISGRCHPHWPGRGALCDFAHMLGFLGRFHLSRGFHSLRMCQNHCARQSLGSHPAFLLCNTRMFSHLLFTTFFQLFILKSLCIHKNLPLKKCAERAPVPITQLPTAGTSCMIIAQHQTQEVRVGIMHRAARIAPVLRVISCVCIGLSVIRS